MKLSIVSLNYNRLEYTKRHLERLFLTTDMPSELIIVSNHDCAQSAEVRSYIKQFKSKNNGNIKQIKKVLNNKNYGVAGGRNSGLIHSEAKIKMVIDDDILLPKNWTSKILHLLKVVDKIGLAGYCVEKERAVKTYKLKTYRDCVFMNKGMANVGGACMVIPHRTWSRLGYFNEDYGVFGFEDADYGVRTWNLGLLNAYVYPERGTQMKDLEPPKEYKIWKKGIYDSPRLRKLYADNLLKYHSKKGLFIGEKKLRNKCFDLH
ncbi:MAG: hypothetical protein B7C24_06810 [Bacteroidetes bacterium 4572_77]|nr:MAG: hypothetical protein B7C24_06810 [Bacteroidetes bacterium 4572_77]